ncbi:MAG: hypothetical protein OEV64_01935 [Desulfobulbaceae bacterium]|nr:hypothetical protein [Desulfobulbaceae bacterium]
MKKSYLTKLIAAATIFSHAGSMAMAGMVVTDSARSWAKSALENAEWETKRAQPATPNTLAVLYYRNITGDKELDPLQKGIAIMLMTDLAKVEKIRLIERIRLQALLDEMELGISGLVDPATVGKVGGLLGASYANSGDILQAGSDKIRIMPGIMKIASLSISSQTDASGTLSELFRVEKEILFKIIEEMNILLTPAERKELEKPLSLSLPALLCLFKGVDFSDQGKYEKAAEMYREALFNDPHLELAREAIDELEQKKLIAILKTTSSRQGGSSGILGTGLALALLGGGAYYALSNSDDDSNNEDHAHDTPQVDTGDTTPTSPPTTDPGDTTPPSVTVVGKKTSVSCYPDSIEFSFNEDMNTSSGTVQKDPINWTWDNYGWTNSRTYRVSWETSNEDQCYIVTELRTILTGFEDKAGNDLPAGSTVHTFYVAY